MRRKPKVWIVVVLLVLAILLYVTMRYLVITEPGPRL
jgi:hypothetical protein